MLPAASAQAGTGTFTVSVKGGYNNTVPLGTASGSMTGVKGGGQASYSVTLCGQNTYPSSRVTIQWGTAMADHTVYYQACETFTGTLYSSYGLTDFEVVVYGSTFYPGNQYTTYSKSAIRYF